MTKQQFWEVGAGGIKMMPLKLFQAALRIIFTANFAVSLSYKHVLKETNLPILMGIWMMLNVMAVCSSTILSSVVAW